MNNTIYGNIIKNVFVLECVLTILKNRNIHRYNNSLKSQAIEKRKLCYKISIDKNCNKIAFYRKRLTSGEMYEWEETIHSDPFNLYSIFFNGGKQK